MNKKYNRLITPPEVKKGIVRRRRLRLLGQVNYVLTEPLGSGMDVTIGDIIANAAFVSS